MNGSIPGRGRVLAALAVGVALLAAGCGGGGGSPGASRPAVHQELVAFAHCMRSHGVPDWPDPLPQGGFPRTGTAEDSGPQAGSAMHTCRHLLPPIQHLSAAQQAQVLTQDLKWARCMRAHGFAVSDPSVRPHAGIVITAPTGFDPSSPQAQAAMKACKQLEGPFILAQGGGS
ncbi:MAG: hypothetical protein ACHQCE_06680 [Streptosporangiales bacterium]